MEWSTSYNTRTSNSKRRSGSFERHSTSKLTTLEDLHNALDDQGTELWLARVKRDVLGPMEAHGVADVIGRENMYPTLPTAVQAYRDRHPDEGTLLPEPE